MRARLLARSGAERVLMGSRMFDAARATVLVSFPNGLRKSEIKSLLCGQLYGNQVDVEAFVESPVITAGAPPWGLSAGKLRSCKSKRDIGFGNPARSLFETAFEPCAYYYGDLRQS